MKHWRRISRVASVLTAAIAAMVLVGSVAAAPLEREHYSFEDSDTFTDTDCGAPITIDFAVHGSGVFMLKDRRPGGPTPPYLFDNYSSVETFTNVANDKTATIKHQGLYKDVKIEHVEGTIYRFTAIETGRPVVVFGPDGERLVFDAGRIRYTFLVDTLGDADLDNDVFLGDVGDSDVAGPHPIFFGDVDFCDLLDVLR
jgi:hypothetical protein